MTGNNTQQQQQKTNNTTTTTSSQPPPQKKQKKEEEEEEEVIEEDELLEDEETMDATIRSALTEIDDCQRELDGLNEKASKEILQVETKYNKLRKPFYDKRSGIIKKIPNFWVNAVINHPQISMLIDEEEEDCLHFLNKLEVEEFENVENGFRIKFIFDENPFFDNKELVKEFQLGPNTDPTCSATTIQWKESMDLSKKQKDIIQLRRKRGLEAKTFFSWFSDVRDPASDDIAEVIKDDLWPNPLQYYLTPDAEIEDDEEEDDEEEDEDEEEEEVVMEEEEEEIEEEEGEGGRNGEGLKEEDE